MRIHVLLLTGMVAAAANAATLIHQYDFSGTSVTDLVGSDNGTLVGGATVSGGTLNLGAAGDRVTFAAQLIPTSGAFTVAMFAQQPKFSLGYAEMISQGSSGGPGFYIGYNSAHNIRIGDGWQYTGVAFPTGTLQHHYAVVRSATDTQLHIDGSLVASRGSPIGMSSTGDNTALGSQFGGREYFTGQIDDLRIYSDALTGGEVAALVPEPGTLGLLGACAAVALSRRRMH